MIEIKTEVAGVVAEILMVAGGPVSADDELLLIESMKMLVPVSSAVAGTIHSFAVELGQSVEAGQLVAMLNPLE